MHQGQHASPGEHFLLLGKDGQHHVFRYLDGQERELYFTLIDRARDPENGLTWSDVFTAMDQVMDLAEATTVQQ
jgi:hypothetical protein